ncbi:MAG TPA: sigma-70 family RNA polymerase sigma factor [Candidatus Ventrimonas merdavium]|nr:sigma-70 family RNA polymerase sigma factor [Candidatus Ventrimonas merdavium]
MGEMNDRFTEIHEHYYPLLRLMAMKKGIPYDEVEDIIQETFIAYYEHYPLDWSENQIRAVLARILRNRCVDYWRAVMAYRVIPMDPELMQETNLGVSAFAGKDTLTIVIERELYNTVMGALKTMKSDWQIVFLLYIVEGRSMHEVSNVLGVSEALCRMRLMRGRNYLREITGVDLGECKITRQGKSPENSSAQAGEASGEA